MTLCSSCNFALDTHGHWEICTKPKREEAERLRSAPATVFIVLNWDSIEGVYSTRAKALEYMEGQCPGASIEDRGYSIIEARMDEVLM